MKPGISVKPEDLPATLVWLRKQKSLSQREAAAQAGISQSYL